MIPSGADSARLASGPADGAGGAGSCNIGVTPWLPSVKTANTPPTANTDTTNRPCQRMAIPLSAAADEPNRAVAADAGCLCAPAW